MNLEHALFVVGYRKVKRGNSLETNFSSRIRGVRLEQRWLRVGRSGRHNDVYHRNLSIDTYVHHSVVDCVQTINVYAAVVGCSACVSAYSKDE